MPSNLFDILGWIMFCILISSWLVETILSGTWNKTYFTIGIPMFTKRIPVGFQHGKTPSSSLLEANFQSAWAGSLAFKELELHTYGFREKLFEIRLVRHTPVMHGVLVFDFKNSEVVVKGFMNLFTLSFSLVWLGGVLISFLSLDPFTLAIAFGLVLFFVLLMGLLYLIQYKQFSEVATIAAETWAKMFLKDMAGSKVSYR